MSATETQNISEAEESLTTKKEAKYNDYSFDTEVEEN